ncbi:hypothetical protein BHE74_00000844 [Ensete ventricosum]|nr:hypothetical protein BHE74_00000844 [Ensete ventricosum]
MKKRHRVRLEGNNDGHKGREEDEGNDCCCCIRCWEETLAASTLAVVGLGGRWRQGRGNDVVSGGGTGEGQRQQDVRLRLRAGDGSTGQRKKGIWSE